MTSNGSWTFLGKQLWARTDEDGQVWLAVFPEDPPTRQWVIDTPDVSVLANYLLHKTGRHEDEKTLMDLLAVWATPPYEDELARKLGWTTERIRATAGRLADRGEVFRATALMGRLIYLQSPVW
jgi:hypothetical protein